MHLHIRELPLEIVRRFDNSYIIRENNWAQSGLQATHIISNYFSPDKSFCKLPAIRHQMLSVLTFRDVQHNK